MRWWGRGGVLVRPDEGRGLELLCDCFVGHFEELPESEHSMGGMYWWSVWLSVAGGYLARDGVSRNGNAVGFLSEGLGEHVIWSNADLEDVSTMVTGLRCLIAADSRVHSIASFLLFALPRWRGLSSFFTLTASRLSRL